MKLCKRCKTEKSLSDFPRQKTNGSQGVSAWCRDCHSEYNKTRPKIRTKGYRLWYTYRLTQDAYDEMLSSQSGTCALCPAKIDSTNLVIDHDHNCCPGARTCGSCVRGMLCRSCNTKLGWYERRIEEIKEYIK